MKSSAIIRLAANFGVSLILLLIFACAESRAQKPLPVRFPFLMEEKFDGDPKWWQDDNEYDWEINSNDGSRYLQLNDEPVRQGLDRPENVCWLKGLNLLDFDIRFRIKCRPVGREERGICVCWGRSFYESQRRNFYFAKLCESSGSCGIRVTAKNKIRSIASEKPTKGVPWTDGWHQVRVWRRVKDGQIRVYFDDMVKPILTARDETYDRGYFGVGSFGNHLSIDDVEFCGRLIRGGDRNDGALPRLKSYEARLYDWAKPGDMTPRIQTRQGIKFCRVPGGTFIKGRKSKRVPSIYDHKILHEKQHLVELSEFWVSACEITQSDYEKVMGTNPSFCRPLKGHDWRKGEDLSQHPVQNVNWFDAIQFCNRLSEKEGRQPCYVIKDIIRHPLPGSSLYEPGITQWVHSAHVSYSKEANGYRLPTDAEWEYACRAGTTTKYFFGDFLKTSQANFKEKLDHTTKVGSYPANRLGIFDMHGNVNEWCHDIYERWDMLPRLDPMSFPSQIYASPTAINIRGGSFTSNDDVCESGHRDRVAPGRPFITKSSYSCGIVGFRVVLTSRSLKLEQSTSKRKP